MLALQRVPDAKVGKSRVHFDVFVDDIEAATTQVEELGGQRWAANSATVDVGGWITRIMTDPEGNEFASFTTRHKSTSGIPIPTR